MSLTASFQGRKVLITGGAGGIGLVIAEKFLEAGAQVVVLDQDEKCIRAVQEQHKGKIECIHTDITDWKGLKSLKERIEKLGAFHHLVNNAAVAKPTEKLMDITEGGFDQIFAVNMKAVINMTQIFADGVKRENLEGASIVNISSISDEVAVPGLALYSCSKAALTMLTKCSALELAPLGIRVNAVRPARVQKDEGQRGRLSGQGPGSELVQAVMKINERSVINRAVEMSEVAESVLFLSSDFAKSITGGGILLDGGIFTR